MSFETLNLLENITVNSAYGRDYNAGSDADTVFYSDKNKGAGYHKNGNGIHTVLFHTEGFVGSITIQATLELYPGNQDWVDVHTETFALDSSNSARSSTITGKFVYIRAAYRIENGEIVTVRYNY
jgi:SOS-response transcriptional repressor LexA